MIYHGYLWQFFQKKKILENKSLSKNHFVENYPILLCLVATLKWVRKLSFDFPYLVKNNSNSHQVKPRKSKDSFSLKFFFPDTIKYRKTPKTIFSIGAFG